MMILHTWVEHACNRDRLSLVMKIKGANSLPLLIRKGRFVTDTRSRRSDHRICDSQGWGMEVSTIIASSLLTVATRGWAGKHKFALVVRADGRSSERVEVSQNLAVGEN